MNRRLPIGSLYRAILIAALSSAGGAPLSAQSRGVLYALSDSMMVELRLDADAAHVAQASPGRTIVHGAYTTGNGRYTVWPEATNAFQPRTITGWNAGVRALMPALATMAAVFPPAIVGRPITPALYFVDASRRLSSLAEAGLRVLETQPTCEPQWVFGISDNGRRLAVNCGTGGLQVVDLFEQRVYPLSAISGLPAAFSADGSAVFMFVFTGSQTFLRKYDIATGDQIGQATVPHGGWIHRDPLHPRLIFVGDQGLTMPEGTVVLDVNTLAVIRTMSLLGTRWAFDPFRPIAYALGTGQLTELDTDTFAIRFTRRDPAFGRPVALTLASVPAAAAALNASVSGNGVTMTWSQVYPGGTADRYQVEVGSASGRTDLVVLYVGPTPRLQVSSVPAGTYYVRVRGENVVGVGPASQEIVVTVPGA
jgi:hypothetical protein